MKKILIAVLMLLGFAVEAQAQVRSAAVMQSSFSPVVKKVAPAVVNIFAQKIVAGQARDSVMNDEFFNMFFGRTPGQSRQKVERSLGSGVIVSPEGMMVTSYHVIAGAKEVQVVFNDRREVSARLINADQEMDIAVLQLALPVDEKVPALEFADSDALEVGDLVLAVGNPFGVGQSVSLGIVSALGRANVGKGQYFIQTDAAINPGNSGGALVNADGALVGINSAIFTKDGGSNGIAFAIPSNAINNMLRGVAATGKIQKTWFGATGQNITPQLVKSLGLKNASGMMVNEVLLNSPAGRAGVLVGDIVTSLDGVAIPDTGVFRGRLDQTPVGQESTLTVVRAGEEVELPITFSALPQRSASDRVKVNGNNPLNGYTVENLSPALNYEMGLALASRGVAVVESAAGIGFAQLQPGDIVVSINGKPLNDIRELKVLLNNPRQRGWQLVIKRGSTLLQMVVQQ